MWKEFRIAVSFLTRLPLPYKGEWDEKSFSRSSVFYPFVGLIIGLIVTAVLVLIGFTGYYSVAAVVALIASVAVSGGIHLDGFMDMCDGVFASRGRERALEIMKDSRVGSFAVIGIVLLMLLKYALYTSLITEAAEDSLCAFSGMISDTACYPFAGFFYMALAMLGAFVFSRFMLICCMLWFPSARKEGLGVTVKRYVSKPALLWGIILMLILGGATGFYPVLIAFVMAFAVIMWFASMLSKFLHGLTGDIYGAMAELGEAVYLLIFLIVFTLLVNCGCETVFYSF